MPLSSQTSANLFHITYFVIVFHQAPRALTMHAEIVLDYRGREDVRDAEDLSDIPGTVSFCVSNSQSLLHAQVLSPDFSSCVGFFFFAAAAAVSSYLQMSGKREKRLPPPKAISDSVDHESAIFGTIAEGHREVRQAHHLEENHKDVARVAMASAAPQLASTQVGMKIRFHFWLPLRNFLNTNTAAAEHVLR
jgi:hypothetical protein